MEDNMIKNTDENMNVVDEENVVKNDSGNKRFRGVLTAAVLVSLVVFVYLLIYFCENTGV